MTKEDNLRRAAYKFYRNSYDLPKKEIPSLASGDKLTIEVMTAFATSPAAQEYWQGWMKIGEGEPPTQDEQIEIFSPLYSVGNPMRHRIILERFLSTCSEATHWRKLSPPKTESK